VESRRGGLALGRQLAALGDQLGEFWGVGRERSEFCRKGLQARFRNLSKASIEPLLRNCVWIIGIHIVSDDFVEDIAVFVSFTKFEEVIAVQMPLLSNVQRERAKEACIARVVGKFMQGKNISNGVNNLRCPRGKTQKE